MTMTSAKPTTCPNCQTTFQPKRRNQRYCHDQCRIDVNNNKAKEKYTLLQDETNQRARLQAKYDHLYAKVQEQIVVARDIEEVEPKVIRWQGKLYERQHKEPDAVRRLGISLQAGGGLHQVAEDILYYRERKSGGSSDPGQYQRKGK